MTLEWRWPTRCDAHADCFYRQQDRWSRHQLLLARRRNPARTYHYWLDEIRQHTPTINQSINQSLNQSKLIHVIPQTLQNIHVQTGILLLTFFDSVMHCCSYNFYTFIGTLQIYVWYDMKTDLYSCKSVERSNKEMTVMNGLQYSTSWLFGLQYSPMSVRWM